MTSHYIECKISAPFDQVAHYLTKYFGNVYTEHMCAPNSRAAVILGETYFFRSNSNAAILMILKETGASVTDLEIIACAGSAGLLGLSWGAHKDYVHKITDSLQRASMNVEVVKEIANYENHQP